MGALLPIRFKEVFVQVTVNGRRQGGTFQNIRQVTITPQAEIKKTKYAGEQRARPDLEIDGYDFTFQANESDLQWLQVWKLFEDAEANGEPFPVVSLAVTNVYRGEPRRTVVLYGNLIMKLDERSASDGDYAQQTWSGACQFLQG